MMTTNNSIEDTMPVFLALLEELKVDIPPDIKHWRVYKLLYAGRNGGQPQVYAPGVGKLNSYFQAACFLGGKRIEDLGKRNVATITARLGKQMTKHRMMTQQHGTCHRTKKTKKKPSASPPSSASPPPLLMDDDELEEMLRESLPQMERQQQQQQQLQQQQTIASPQQIAAQMQHLQEYYWQLLQLHHALQCPGQPLPQPHEQQQQQQEQEQEQEQRSSPVDDDLDSFVRNIVDDGFE